MTIRRSAAAVGAVVLGLAALSACSKPTPVATVTVGSDTINSQAACYNDGKPLSTSALRSCLSQTPKDNAIKVRAIDSVHIGVDPDVAKNGWLVFSGSQARTDLIKDTYRSFSGASILSNQATGSVSSAPVVIDIVEMAGNSSGALGVWQFKLVPQS